MAYFSNSTDGECFDEQCNNCKYDTNELPEKKYCPIFWVQFNFNYEAANNPIARQILDALVKDDGTCTMFQNFKSDFSKDKNQLKFKFHE